MCQSNARIRQKISWNENLADDREKVPEWLWGEPLHFDHLHLAHLNDIIQRTGSSWVPFKDLFEIKEDTGEQFLSEYQREQQVRSETVPVHRHNTRCQCLLCAANVEPLPWRTVEGAALGNGAPNAAAVNRDDTGGVAAVAAMPAAMAALQEDSDSDAYEVFGGGSDGEDNELDIVETEPSPKKRNKEYEMIIYDGLQGSPEKVRASQKQKFTSSF